MSITKHWSIQHCQPDGEQPFTGQRDGCTQYRFGLYRNRNYLYRSWGQYWGHTAVYLVCKQFACIYRVNIYLCPHQWRPSESHPDHRWVMYHGEPFTVQCGACVGGPIDTNFRHRWTFRQPDLFQRRCRLLRHCFQRGDKPFIYLVSKWHCPNRECKHLQLYAL